jgi:glutaredoxin
MYSTTHCPVCHKARRWLLEAGVPYRERDIEKDEAAAHELSQKGQAQGLPVSGVPVFEVGGRLLPGFDPAALRAAIARTGTGTPPGARAD